MQYTLPLADLCQRHRNHRASYRPAREPFDPSRYGVEEISASMAKDFIKRHHYSGNAPYDIVSYGLFETIPNARPELCGVLTFSVPVRIPSFLAEILPDKRICDLGRLVLLDHVLANAESWFVTKSLGALAQRKTLPDGKTPLYQLCLSHSDPVPRPTQAGTVIFPGHYGTIYQAKSAIYTGRTSRRLLVLDRDGLIVSERALSKLRNDEAGAATVYDMLIGRGAPKIEPGEDSRAYVARALHDGPFHRIRHHGNHRYIFRPAHKGVAAALQKAFLAVPYPKTIDPVPLIQKPAGLLNQDAA